MVDLSPALLRLRASEAQLHDAQTAVTETRQARRTLLAAAAAAAGGAGGSAVAAVTQLRAETRLARLQQEAAAAAAVAAAGGASMQESTSVLAQRAAAHRARRRALLAVTVLHLGRLVPDTGQIDMDKSQSLGLCRSGFFPLSSIVYSRAHASRALSLSFSRSLVSFCLVVSDRELKRDGPES